MSLAAPLSPIHSPEEINRHFAWHQQQDLPLVLMCGAGEGQWLARIVEFVDGNAALQVVCKDLLPFSPGTPISYAVIGATPNGTQRADRRRHPAELGSLLRNTPTYPALA